MFKQLGRPKGTRNVYLEEDLQRRIFLGKKLKRRRRQIKLTQTDIAKEMKDVEITSQYTEGTEL